MLAKNAEGEQWQGHIVVALQQGKQAVSTVAVPHTVAYHVLTSIQNSNEQQQIIKTTPVIIAVEYFLVFCLVSKW